MTAYSFYDPTVVYREGDTVTVGGAAYICQRGHTGNAPPNWPWDPIPTATSTVPAGGTSDDSTSVAAAMAAAQASGQTLKFAPGVTYSFGGMVLWSGADIEAVGSRLQHNAPAGGVFIDTNGASDWEWRGGLLVPKQSNVGPTTDTILARNGLRGRMRAKVQSLTGAFGTGAGLHVLGRSGLGIYESQFEVQVRQYAGDAISVDGWDVSAGISFANENLFLNCQGILSGGQGLRCAGGLQNTFINTDLESNTGVALSHDTHTDQHLYLGAWLENNNGGLASDQMSLPAIVNTLNRFIGHLSHPATQAEKDYWNRWEDETSGMNVRQLTIAGILLSSPGVNALKLGPGGYFTAPGGLFSGTTIAGCLSADVAQGFSQVPRVIRGASGQTADLLQLQNSAGTTKAAHLAGGTLLSDDATQGFILKDTQATPHYWRVTVSTLGVVTTTDLGTARPTV